VSSTALPPLRPLKVAERSGGNSNGENTVIVVAAVAGAANSLLPSKELTETFSVSCPTKFIVGV
jgi:hypothetical protein